ncbi:MAG TPA: acyl-CoA thioesterase [Ramlibacter sp.]|nr:acyl-CoA thioesterase [Ramlibacter sp.]
MRWGDCDPAGVVYTARFTDYVLEAFHDFLGWLIGTPLQARLAELDFGTPAKSLQFVFLRSLYPDDEIALEMRVADLRARSFDLAITALGAEDVPIFHARIGVVCVHHAVRQSRAIPPELKERLLVYRNACSEADVNVAA